ncbi:hypothetical protein [Leisingera aquimarina]|uniref:hypothetical protein n=1 Tax=Leisingera aquimarina TaxID=476529 RepID=UPI00041082CF|nr:hypothetical protein [Leisingera aquimarina]
MERRWRAVASPLGGKAACRAGEREYLRKDEMRCLLFHLFINTHLRRTASLKQLS